MDRRYQEDGWDFALFLFLFNLLLIGLGVAALGRWWICAEMTDPLLIYGGGSGTILFGAILCHLTFGDAVRYLRRVLRL